jgi:hypothetical protein
MNEFSFHDVARKNTVGGSVPKGSVLFEGGISANGENITPIDLFSIPEGINDDQLDLIIAKNLNIPANELEVRLSEISHYWDESKKFYQTFLVANANPKATFPREIEKKDKFENLIDLRKTLRKATHLKKGENLGLGPFYCALFSIMIAEREYEKEEFSGLANESAYIKDKFFKADEDGIQYFYSSRNEDAEWTKVGVLIGDGSWMNARFTYRGKTRNSAVCKLASKPEFSASEIIKDGIGLKFEVSTKKDVENILFFLSVYMQDNFSASNIVFENTALFDKNEKEEISKKFGDRGVTYMSNVNKSSHKNFKVAKIRGRMKIPQNGKDGNMIAERNFEIQIVLTDNENETGLAQNKIYKGIQKLSLMTRLFGSFSENYLDLISKEASEASGLSNAKIKDHILNNYLYKLVSRSRDARYISRDQFERWKKAGMLPLEIKINGNGTK